MPVPVKIWKQARGEIREALESHHNKNYIEPIVTRLFYAKPIAEELVRLMYPDLEGIEFENLAWKVALELL